VSASCDGIGSDERRDRLGPARAAWAERAGQHGEKEHACREDRAEKGAQPCKRDRVYGAGWLGPGLAYLPLTWRVAYRIRGSYADQTRRDQPFVGWAKRRDVHMVVLASAKNRDVNQPSRGAWQK
jgi:hypothetical protein